MKTSTILSARDAIGDLTPLQFDCGRRCGAACCFPDQDGQGGVYLLPGEDALLSEPSFGHIEQTSTALMLVCDGSCNREARPMLCRIFPLTPFYKKDGTLSVRMDARAKPLCPLTAGGAKALQPAFVRAVREACAMLMEDAEIRIFLEKWMCEEREYRAEQKRLQQLFT